MSDKILLVDGHSILSRAFYGIPPLTNSQGLHTNGIYGFLGILFRALEDHAPTHLFVAFDVKEPTFRHKLYPEYKGNRKPMPPELHEQVPVLKDVLSAMGIAVVELPGYEADDVLGTLSARAAAEGYEGLILSGDKDMLQLASEQVHILLPVSGSGRTETTEYGPEQVLERYQVTPYEFISVKALMGDSSDNVPGVPGIGEKTAVKMISGYHTLENLYEHRDEQTPRMKKLLEEHFDEALFSRTLVTINTASPVERELEEGRLGDIYTKEAYEKFYQLEFKQYLTRFSAGSQPETQAEEPARLITAAAEAEEVFAALTAAEQIGLEWVEDAGLAAYAAETGRVFFFAGEELSCDMLRGLTESLLTSPGTRSVLDAKKLLRALGLEDGELPFDDAALAAYLINPLKNAYGPEDIARDYLSMVVPSRKEWLAKRTFADAAKEDPEGFAGAMSAGAMCAEKAQPILAEKLAETGMDKLYREIEIPLVRSLARMEKAGIQVERSELAEYGNRLVSRIDELQQEICEQAGRPFNILSPKQLGEVLFEDLQLPHAKKTKTGYSTSVDVLDKLREVHPIVNNVLEYRQLTKLKSTYADGLAAYVREDGRIHGTFNQMITATGRISSTEPNLQNIPVRLALGREIRRVFTAREGCVLLDADYSQIELRILAHMSGDTALQAAYHTAQDIHAITAAKVFGIPLEEVDAAKRRFAKAVNFGIVYGISAFGLSEDLNISRQEAMATIEQYFETYPGVKAFLDHLVSSAKEKGYAETMYGRRRPVPELASSQFMQRSFGERVAMNSPIQGSAADIMKIAMNRVDAALREKQMKTRIVLQIHDELLLEAPLDEADAAAEILKSEMESAAVLAVPLEVEVHQGGSWLEAKE